MNVKIQGGGNGEYANTGSSAAATRYLMHEEQEKAAIDVSGFFSHDADNISEGKVVYDLDHNKAKLCNSDSKFFVLTISPSKREILQMGKTQEEQEKNFKDYIRGCVMNQYAENFGKGLNGSDIMYYGKIHFTRGDNADGQMHAHILVSRKSKNGKLKLSPQTSHRATGKHGTVKDGFDRVHFFQSCESGFDTRFNYVRKPEESFDYCNARTKGYEGAKTMAEIELKFEAQQKNQAAKDKAQREKQEKQLQQQKQKQHQQQEKQRHFGRGF